MARLRLFGPAREAAGRGADAVPGDTVAEILAEARRRFGPTFAIVLAGSKVWVNGEESGPSASVGEDDEVAVIPPVSGGT
jgi:sulfur-carrier protein